jgi:hypothetical protein
MAFARLSRLVFLAITLASTSVDVLAQTRVRGTIVAFDGVTLSVQGGGLIRIDDKTEIVFAQPIALADIQPGDFLGVTSVKAQNGALTAYEVRRFPQALNPGHRPFDGRDDQTMTNATVGALVQSASGRDLVLIYDGGTQQIKVPPEASVSQLVPGNKGHLVPGAAVNLTHKAGVAVRVQVSPKN